jgi:hypothetical protein
MARRQLLTDEQWARLLAPPNDEREIVRHYTLSRDDLDLIAGKRSGHSHLGFAVLLCYISTTIISLPIGRTCSGSVHRSARERSRLRQS